MVEECPECGSLFVTPSELAGHVGETHTLAPEPPTMNSVNGPTGTGLACVLCGERFWTPESLTTHSLRPHYTSNRRRGLRPTSR